MGSELEPAVLTLIGYLASDICAGFVNTIKTGAVAHSAPSNTEDKPACTVCLFVFATNSV